MSFWNRILEKYRKKSPTPDQRSEDLAEIDKVIAEAQANLPDPWSEIQCVICGKLGLLSIYTHFQPDGTMIEGPVCTGCSNNYRHPGDEKLMKIQHLFRVGKVSELPSKPSPTSTFAGVTMPSTAVTSIELPGGLVFDVEEFRRFNAEHPEYAAMQKQNQGAPE